MSKIPVEELKDLKSLLDAGIINQEEFDAKKAQLLSGMVDSKEDKADSPVETKETSSVKVSDEKSKPEDADYLNGHVISDDDAVGLILREINNAFSYFGKESIEKACDLYKKGFIEKKESAKIDYDKLLYSKELIRAIDITNQISLSPSHAPSIYGKYYNNVSYDVGIVAAPFTEALKKTELSRLAPGKIKEMAAQYDEYKENPPTWKEIIKAQDVAQISMSIALDIETVLREEIAALDSSKRSIVIDHVGSEFMAFAIWYVNNETNAKLIGGKGNAFQIIKNRWEKYEAALAGTNDYSQWARPFLSPAQVDSLKNTKETAVFLALGDSVVNAFRAGIKKGLFSFGSKNTTLEFRILKYLLVKYEDFVDTLKSYGDADIHYGSKIRNDLIKYDHMIGYTKSCDETKYSIDPNVYLSYIKDDLNNIVYEYILFANEKKMGKNRDSLLKSVGELLTKTIYLGLGAILYIQKEGYQKGYSGVIDKLNNGAPDIEQYVLDEVERQGNNSKKYKSNIEIRVRDHMKIVEAVYDADRTYDLIAFNDQKKESIAGMYLYGIALGEDFCVEHPYK